MTPQLQSLMDVACLFVGHRRYYDIESSDYYSGKEERRTLSELQVEIVTEVWWTMKLHLSFSLQDFLNPPTYPG